MELNDCKVLRQNVQIQGNYSNIFSDKVKKETVKTVMDITRFRNEYLEERKLC